MSDQQSDTAADGTEPGTPGSGRSGTGDVSSPPSRTRREQDPGSVATEFGDRADEAPDTEIAHPSI